MYLENNKYDALIKSCLGGESSPEETLELLNWVSESEENRAYFKAQKDAEEVWNLTDFAMPESIDVEAALDAVNRRIDAMEEMEEAETKTVEMPWLRRNYKYVSGIAAALVIALFFGFLVTKPFNSTITVASNEQNVEKAFYLPDGTSVTFNGDGEITYPKRFSKATRAVNFEGVALFDVAKDDNKPFVIHCDNVDVEVLGTTFLIYADKTADKYYVDLYSGKVVMTSLDPKGHKLSQLEIMPGERGVLYGDGQLKALSYPEVKAEELRNDHVLDFNNVALSTIVETLEHVYDVEIELDEAYASKKLTARFTDQDSVEEVLETIATVFDFTVVKKDGVYLIR